MGYAGKHMHVQKTQKNRKKHAGFAKKRNCHFRQNRRRILMQFNKKYKQKAIVIDFSVRMAYIEISQSDSGS